MTYIYILYHFFMDDSHIESEEIQARVI